MSNALSQKRGSAVSTREMLRAAIQGNLLVFKMTDGSSVAGYLGGLDDYHWKVVRSNGGVLLVHKGSAMVVEILAPSLDAEDLKADIIQILGPFRAAAKKILNGDRET